MMQADMLKQDILTSLADLKRRFGTLSNDDIAADIINVICKHIISSTKFNYKTSSQPMMFFQNNWANCSSYVMEVVSSLRKELPEIITEQTTMALTQNVCFNLGWNEMPAFLDNYFSEKHEQSSLNGEEQFDFMSIKHERFVNNCMVANSQVDRNIRISCWNGRRDMTIAINPTLSLKRAHLVRRSHNLYIYQGVDPDYIFEVRFDDFDDIDYVSVSLSSRNLKLAFY